MSKFEKWFWGLEIILLIIGVAMNVVNTNDTGLYLVIAGLVVQAVYFQIQLINIRNTKPNIIMDDEVYSENISTTLRTYAWLESPQVTKYEENLTTDTITTIHDPNIPYKKPGDPFVRYYVRFRNVMGKQVGTRNAESVHAKLTFRNKEDYKKVSHDLDRWVNYPTPDMEQKPVEIEVNGDPEDLYLIIKDPENNECYIFSDASYTHNKFDPRKENLRLNLGSYDVEIEMKDNKGWSNTYSLTMVISSEEPVFDAKKRF